VETLGLKQVIDRQLDLGAGVDPEHHWLIKYVVVAMLTMPICMSCLAHVLYRCAINVTR